MRRAILAALVLAAGLALAAPLHARIFTAIGGGVLLTPCSVNLLLDFSNSCALIGSMR